ncbi:MAG: type III-B CRISPR-associated protein Cas10/Cmr2, partial [Arcobacter sp.]|nr:type III-B CRISPR-associated protein Cas10/Cmr2 [Arcobacter sp.]
KKNKIKNEQFILLFPDARKLDTTNEYKSAGIFPDRLILKSEDGFFDELQSAVDDAKKEIYKNFDDNCIEYLDKYLRTNIIEKELGKDANVIFKINKLLANTELQSPLIPEDELCFESFLQNIDKTNLFKNVFGNERAYPSIIEIALRKINDGENLTKDKIDDLRKEGNKILTEAEKNKKEENQDFNFDDDDELITGISNDDKLKKKFKTPHKYIAIVQADGDNVGQLIKQIYNVNPNLIEDFSKALSKFSFDALRKIKNYGGEAVYTGGDDLLFFAPVNTNDKNIFQLLNGIDEKFQDCLLKNEKLKPALAQITNSKDECNKAIKQPSMSYGLSITYYKYPMHEALSKARELLFEKAKTGNKNNIAYALQKHSGQTFEDVINKGSKFHQQFIEILNSKNENVISSLLYNLENQEFILEKIAGDKDRLTNFFDNFYDEDIHKKNKDFINKLQEMIYITYSETGNDIKKTLNKVYSALRFVKFINSKNNE